MRVETIMTRTIATVAPDAPLADAIRLMISVRVGGLPVVDSGGKLVGIITESDLLHRSELGTQKPPRRWLSWLIQPGLAAEDYARANGRYVRELMQQTVITIDADAALAEAAMLMQRHQVNRLPVLREGRLVGIVARSDLVRALSGFLNPSYDESLVTDGEIKSAIERELKGQDWAPRTVEISVHDGVVDLRGSIFDERERDAIRIAAENVPGVKAVKDHLMWIEPLTGTVLQSSDNG